MASTSPNLELTLMEGSDRPDAGILAENFSKIDAKMPYLVPTGSILFFAATTPPAAFFECTGAAISRTTYAALFSVIGTAFGSGDGSTTFNIPDLRGEFVRGWSNGRAGVDWGRVFGSAQASSMATTGSGTSPTSVYATTPFGEVRPRNVALLPCIKY